MNFQIWIFENLNFQIWIFELKFSNLNFQIWIFKFKFSNFHILKFGFSNLNFQIFKFSNIQIFKCSNIHIFKYPMIQIFKYSKIEIFEDSEIQIFKDSKIRKEGRAEDKGEGKYRWIVIIWRESCANDTEFTRDDLRISSSGRILYRRVDRNANSCRDAAVVQSRQRQEMDMRGEEIEAGLHGYIGFHGANYTCDDQHAAIKLWLGGYGERTRTAATRLSTVDPAWISASNNSLAFASSLSDKEKDPSACIPPVRCTRFIVFAKRR